MPASVTILCGPARSGKTERLLARYREALKSSRPGATLWLAPTWRAANEVRDLLLDGALAGCFSPGVMTFARFAQSVLEKANLPIRPITPLMKRELVRQILAAQASAGRLNHFRPIAGTSGLTDLVCEFIGELKRLEIWPEDFRKACDARGAADKDRELVELYELYQQSLREHGLFDAEGQFWSARDELARTVVSGQWSVAGEGSGEGFGDLETWRFGDLEAESSLLATDHWPLTTAASPLPSLIVADGFTDFTRTQHEILAILASHAEELQIAIPLEAEPRRNDLFSKPMKTLAELRRRHPAASVVEMPRPVAPSWPALAHLERTLFVNPRGRGAGDGGREESGEWRVASGEGAVVGGQWSVAGEGISDSKSLNPQILIANSLAKPRGPLAPGYCPSPLTPHPSPLVPRPSLRIKILAAARQLGEIEMVAARVKRLLFSGVKPGEIAVVFRSLDAVSELVEEVFSKLGIPAVIESGRTLGRSPALKALVTLLQLDLDDWPFDRLRAVLGNNYFQPTGIAWNDGDVATVERTIRHLQIPHGRKTLLDQASGVTLKAVRQLAAAFDAMPERATLPDWAKAWQQLADATGLSRAMDNSSIASDRLAGGLARRVSPSPDGIDPSVSHSDHRAWARLMQAARESDTLATWLDHRPPELDRRAALDALSDLLSSDRLGHAGDETGQVRVLKAESVRSLRVPYLFLAGLSEKAFPPPDREDRLYSEAEYLRLIDAGLPLVARTERTRDEMLLFYEVATRATKRLYLSYPSLDDAAQPLLPSPLLGEVEQAFGRGVIPRTERTDLRPIPRGEPLCQADFRIKAVATALDGNVALLAGLLNRGEGRGASGEALVVSGQWPVGSEEGRGERGEGRDLAATNPNPPNLQIPKSPDPSSATPLATRHSPLATRHSPLLSGLAIIARRQNREQFGPAEGIFESAAAHSYMAARFPQQHVFSATDLERYATCPFRYLFERVLKIEPVEDLALEFDVQNRGSVVHNVLALFHRRVNERLGRPASPSELEPAEFDAMLAKAIEDSLPPEPAGPLQAALREIDRRLVVEWLSQYREQLRSYDDLWKDFERPMAAELFEVSFGRGGEAPPSVDTPFEIASDGRTVRISGRIDRIDTGVVAGEAALNIVDYKTGRSIASSAESMKAGTTLQLPLYAMAASELLLIDRNAMPWRAGYWYIRDGGFKPRQSLQMYCLTDDGRIELAPEWEDIRSSLGDTILALVESLRSARFPVFNTDPHCTGYCPFRTICRINQVRSLEKTIQPAAER